MGGKDFGVWLFHPFAGSPLGSFAPWLFRPWLVCISVNWNTSLNNELPVYSTEEERIAQGEGANQLGGKCTRGRISQKANHPGGEKAKGWTSQEWKSQGANEPGGEQARGRTGKGAKNHNSSFLRIIQKYLNALKCNFYVYSRQNHMTF